MAYSVGRGLGFRPVCSSLTHGMPRDRWMADQFDSRIELLFQEIRQLKQSSYNSSRNLGDFPPLPLQPSIPVATQPTSTTRPTAPVGLYTKDGIRVFFDPTRPPPQRCTSSRTLPVRAHGAVGDSSATQMTSGPRRTAVERPQPLSSNRLPQPRSDLVNANSGTSTGMFDRLVNNLFRYLQLSHHRKNWNILPKSLKSRLDEFVLDINPPLVNDSLKASLAIATNSYRDGIKSSVLRHLDDQIASIEEQLRNAPADDVERAARWATTRLRTKLQRRFDARANEAAVTKAISLVGLNNNTVIPTVVS